MANGIFDVEIARTYDQEMAAISHPEAGEPAVDVLAGDGAALEFAIGRIALRRVQHDHEPAHPGRAGPSRT